MAVPGFQAVMRPLLDVLADGQVHTMRQATEALADRLALTGEERRQLLPSGQQTVFSNRVAWAKTHLKMAGLIENPSRGSVRLSPLGQEVLREQPPRIDMAFLRRFPSYVEFTRKAQPAPADSEAGAEAPTTPEELLESSHRALRDALAEELLERVKGCSPQFFERLVVELLVAMGYGGSLADAGQAVGRTGDGGIDGIIKEDKLGLDVVCIQATGRGHPAFPWWLLSHPTGGQCAQGGRRWNPGSDRASTRRAGRIGVTRRILRRVDSA